MPEGDTGFYQGYWSKINAARAKKKANQEKEQTKRLLARAKRVPKKNDNLRSDGAEGEGQG